MVVCLLSTCPAANGVRRVPTHMPLQILLIYQVLIISTPSDFQPVATCGVRKSNQPVFIGHMPQVRIGCSCELVYTCFDSSSWFAFPVKHRMGDLSSCSGSSVTPCTLWASHCAPLQAWGWAAVPPDLSLAWLSQSGYNFPGKGFLCTLNGVGSLVCLWNSPEPL